MSAASLTGCSKIPVGRYLPNILHVVSHRPIYIVLSDTFPSPQYFSLLIELTSGVRVAEYRAQNYLNFLRITTPFWVDILNFISQTAFLFRPFSKSVCNEWTLVESFIIFNSIAIAKFWIFWTDGRALVHYANFTIRRQSDFVRSGVT